MQDSVHYGLNGPSDSNNSDYSRFILPIFYCNDETTFVGTAFCIDNYLITAGHVVSDFRVYFVKNDDEFYELSPYDWFTRLIPTKDKLEKDIAIYPMPDLKSPLSIAQHKPKFDSEANVICWQKANYSIQRMITNSLILDNHSNENFYRIATTQRITHGSSGCPILSENEVVGMLTIGVDKCVLNREEFMANGRTNKEITGIQKLNNNTCYILTPEFINKILNNIDSPI